MPVETLDIARYTHIQPDAQILSQMLAVSSVDKQWGMSLRFTQKGRRNTEDQKAVRSWIVLPARLSHFLLSKENVNIGSMPC